MIFIKAFLFLVTAWLTLILAGGILGDPKVVLDAFKAKQLLTSTTPDGLLFFNDDRLKAWSQTNNPESIKLSNGDSKRIDTLYVSTESSDASTCEMIASNENGTSLQINDVALKIPFVFLWQSRGGSSAFQSAVGEILDTSGHPELKLKELWYTAASSTLLPSQKCLLILANVKARISSCKDVDNKGFCPSKSLRVRYAIVGAEAIANAVFEKPVAKLNLCERSIVAASYNEPLSQFSWASRDTSLGTSQRAIRMINNYHNNHPEADIPVDNCEAQINGQIRQQVFKKLALASSHWLPQTKKALLIGASEGVPTKKFINFHNNVTKAFAALLVANPSWSKETLFDVTVFKDDMPYLHAASDVFQKKGVDKNQSAGSLVKLLVLKEAALHKKDLSAPVIAMSIPNIEDKHHIVGSKLSLAEIYCHSYNEGVFAFENSLDGEMLKASFQKQGFNAGVPNPSVSDIRVALATERTSATSNDIHHLAYDLVELGKKDALLRFISTRAALGDGCTLSAAKELFNEKKLYLAKTGTYDRGGTITNKLAVWAWVENGSTYTVVSRLIRPQLSGICTGSCINHHQLLPLYRSIMQEI